MANTPLPRIAYRIDLIPEESSVRVNVYAIVKFESGPQEVELLKNGEGQDMEAANEIMRESIGTPNEEVIRLADNLRIKKLCSA